MDPVLQAEADYLLCTWYTAVRHIQAMRDRLGLTKGKKPFEPLLVSGAASYEQRMLEADEARLGELEKYMVSLISTASARYKFVAYLADTPLPPQAVLAVLVYPPDYTLKPVGFTKPGTWISFGFMCARLRDGTRVCNRLTKIFMRSIFYFYLRPGQILSYSRQLLNLYQSKIKQYMNQGRTTSHARRLAIRDVVRVYLGNAWLIRMLELLENKVVEPHEIIPPYEHAKNPSHIYTYIDPEYTVKKDQHKWRNYTWKRLYDEIGWPQYT